MSVKLKYDPKHNVARIFLRGGVSAATEEIAPGVLVDFAEDGLPIAIEFLDAEGALGGVPTGVEFEVTGLTPAAKA
jgi:uncharacterized protein YuzE